MQAGPAWSFQYETWLARLTELPGVSGEEDAVRAFVARELGPRGDHMEVDALGNLYVLRRARRVARGRSPLRVMLAAHMDEVGLMLTREEGRGFFAFEPVGGLSPRHLLGQRVSVGRKGIPGVIGFSPVHLQRSSDRNRWPGFQELRVAISPQTHIEPGTRATFATPFHREGPNIWAKALDDRVGVATLMALWDHLPDDVEVWAVFTVQEEVGLRGATVAARRVRPHLALALDCTPAMDIPGPDGREPTLYNVHLDQGPALYIADRRTISDPRLVHHFSQVARRYGIPFQFRQAGRGATDAGAIHREAGGIPSLSISVPARYLHGPVALMRVTDWVNTFRLVWAGLRHLAEAWAW